MRGQIDLAYEVFLELPVAAVLAVLWLFGAVLLVACALALYLDLYLYMSLQAWL